MNSQRIVQEHADDWKWLHLPSSSFTGPHLDSGQQNLEETPSHVAKKQFQSKGWSRPLDLNADHAHLQTISRSVCCHICVYPAHGRTNPTNQPRPHIIIVKKDNSSSPKMTNHPQLGNSVQPYSCIQVAKWTHQQSTDQLTWMKHTVTHRDDCRVHSPTTMKGEKENKFSYDFSFARYSPLVVSHSRLLNLWC